LHKYFSSLFILRFISEKFGGLTIKDKSIENMGWGKKDENYVCRQLIGIVTLD